MGSGRFNPKDWEAYATTNSYETKTTDEIFTSRRIDAALDVKGVRVRESRDSSDNPQSTAIIIAQDVTGSMGMISDHMARKGVPTLVSEIYQRRPVTDPHIMCMAIGDMECDRAPVQATQFEADLRIAQQLEKFYLEGGGGGNPYESYIAAWYMGARHTSTDCVEKRGKKGYLFTIGDELPTPMLRARDLNNFFGDNAHTDISARELLTEVSRVYEVFHIIVEEGSYARGRTDQVFQDWNRILPQRAIRLADHTKLAEVIVSAIQVNEGHDHDDVASSWEGNTAVVVRNAVSSLSAGRGSGTASL
jgi:hypothetical protein